jgi:RNA polymerase sigma-70 factor (ECF subfamily)
MDELKAIRRLKNGDMGGLEILIAHYQDKAVRTAYLVTQHEPMAEDVVQDSFVRFYERIRYFDETRAFEPYFLRSVINAALNAIEKENHGSASNEALDAPVLESLLARAVSVQEQVEYSQLKHAVSKALEELSPRQRAVVVQRYYLEMSEKEMTETLDVTPGTIKRLLHAARNRLRSLLGSERNAE